MKIFEKYWEPQKSVIDESTKEVKGFCEKFKNVSIQKTHI